MMATRDLTRVALLAAMALALFVLESVAPRPLPWMKLGLGNTAVLVSLLLFGPRPAIAVALIKVGVGSLVTGGFAGPAFVLAAGAGGGSLGVMAAADLLLATRLSPVGISVLGAVTHQLAQLLLASAYLGHPGLLGLLPLFIVSGVLSGAVTGMIAHLAVQRLLAARPDEAPGPRGA